MLLLFNRLLFLKYHLFLFLVFFMPVINTLFLFIIEIPKSGLVFHEIVLLFLLHISLSLVDIARFNDFLAEICIFLFLCLLNHGLQIEPVLFIPNEICDHLVLRRKDWLIYACHARV